MNILLGRRKRREKRSVIKRKASWRNLLLRLRGRGILDVRTDAKVGDPGCAPDSTHKTTHLRV